MVALQGGVRVLAANEGHDLRLDQPVTLTIHCRNGQTQMQIIHDPAAPPDPDLAEQIMRGLTEVALSLPNPPIQAPGLAAHLR